MVDKEQFSDLYIRTYKHTYIRTYISTVHTYVSTYIRMYSATTYFNAITLNDYNTTSMSSNMT